MTSNVYYCLEADERDYIKRISECLNMVQFVFTHHPELRRQRKEDRKKTHEPAHPHTVIFNNAQFTIEQLHAWSKWIDDIIVKGRESIPLQHPAYREGHEMALARLRETADEFLHLFHENA